MHTELPDRIPAVGLPAVDESHRRLFDELAVLALMADPEFVDRYPAAVAALERDFREEEALMMDAGPATFRAHIEQHAQILAALHQAASGVLGGNAAPGREVVMLLRQWLPFHIGTMDNALAQAATG